MNRLEAKAAVSLAAVYMLRMLGLFMVMPVIVLLAKDYPGYSPLMVGIAIGGYGLTQALLQIPAGVMSDRIGRKPVIYIGLLMFALGSLVAALATTMEGLIVGRVLQGAGAIAGAIMALASDVSREEQRAKVMAVIGIAIGFSFYLSLLLGPALAAKSGLQGIFWLTALLAVAALPLVKWLVPNPVQAAPSHDVLPSWGQLNTLWRDPSLTKLNVSVFVLHMLITLVFVQVPTLISEQGWALNRHWSFYLPVLLMAIVGMVLLMGLTARGKLKLGLIASALAMAVAQYGLYTVNSSWQWAMAWMTLFFIGFNFLEANFPAMVSSLAPAGRKGSAMGIYASFQFLGAFAGGLLSGAVSEYISGPWVFMAGALLTSAWVLLLVTVKSTERVRRVALPLGDSQLPNATLVQRLSGLSGIKELVVDDKSNTLYLKVHGKSFDLDQVKQLLA